jgi:NAD(P)-dependent dehydrogenase (short-subunit alcohol dehydrogenase family)
MGDLDGLGYAGSTTVVVGCSTGIGEATVRILNDLGAKVHAVSRNEPDLPFEAFYPTDLTDFDGIAATAEALAGIGPIDNVLVASGVPATRPVDEVMRVNYVGLRRLVELVVPSMADKGNIAVSGSNTAYGWERSLDTLLPLVKIDDPAEALKWLEEHPEVIPESSLGTYITSKHALNIWVTYAAPALAQSRGIRLNCVCPGLTETKMVEELVERAGTRAMVDAYPNPLFGRITTAEEAAWPLVVINSRINAVITGTVVWADQGAAAGLAAGALTFM